jgi:hypothetical protein
MGAGLQGAHSGVSAGRACVSSDSGMRMVLSHVQKRGKVALAAAATGAVLASVLVAGSAVAASPGTYTGHTSQGKSHPVSLTVSPQKKLGFHIQYVETCFGSTGKAVGGSYGSFGFQANAGVVASSTGQFSYTASPRHVKTSGSPPQYFNSTDKVVGRIRGATASGTASFSGKFYNARGHYVGSCKTGTVRWSVKKK